LEISFNITEIYNCLLALDARGLIKYIYIHEKAINTDNKPKALTASACDFSSEGIYCFAASSNSWNFLKDPVFYTK
jgi:hypothetical protein